ncbi:MAG: patatin-like phospholipase family protein, partial [Planctomycetota bacterium]
PNDPDGRKRFGLRRPSYLYLWYHLSLLSVVTLLALGLALVGNKALSMHLANLGPSVWIFLGGGYIGGSVVVPLAVAYVGSSYVSPRTKGSTLTMHYWAAIDLALLVALFFFGRHIAPAAASICDLIAIAVSVYGFLSWFAEAIRNRAITSKGIRAPKLADDGRLTTLWVPPGGVVVAGLALVALFVGGRDAYPYRIESLGRLYEGTGEDGVVDIQEALERKRPGGAISAADWSERWTGDERGSIVVVCASGGGIAAAGWTVAVLEALEAQVDGFEDHVALITGASGGILGAAAWVATLEGRGQPTPPDLDLYEGITADALTGVARTLVHRDLWLALFAPGHVENDRGCVLEKAWKDAGIGLDATMGDLREFESAGGPSLVFSPMLVEDGRRLLISNLDLSALTRSGSVGAGPASVSALEFDHLFPGELAKLPLRTAARMSATFPVVSPAASLPTSPRRRVVDAGYYDNFGVDLAIRWLEHALTEADPARPRPRVLVL